MPSHPDEFVAVGHDKKIYVLLVGINDYLFPVSPLRGCIKDVDRVEKYLRTHFGGDPTRIRYSSINNDLTIELDGRLHLCVLKDQQATYENIVHGFREHLVHAGPEDAVWFHFSGHGTESFTAKQFYEHIEPNGKDQNLVCYQESAQEGQRLLSDKELAVLLHEIGTSHEKPNPPHIIVSLDCCHSGSGTRFVNTDSEIQTRSVHLRKATNWREAENSGETRPLETYLFGYYTTYGLAIPLMKHILFSACESVQTAGDMSQGGIFTMSLMKSLEGAHGQINYSDLFVQTRACAYQLRAAQTPKFETIGGFDPYTRFLDGTALGSPDRYPLVFENKNWFVPCGAIHGLPLHSDHGIEVDIFKQGISDKKEARAKIRAVGAQKSQLMSIEGDLSAEDFYQAVIRYLPAAPMFVLIKGDHDQRIQQLFDAGKGSRTIQLVREGLAEKMEDPQLEIEVVEDAYLLRDRRSKRLVRSIGDTLAAPRLALVDMEKMANWERVLKLDNPKSGIREWIDLELILKNQSVTNYKGEELRIYVDEQNFIRHANFLVAGFVPQVKVKKVKQRLYCYLFNLRSNYAIVAKEGELIFRPEEHDTANEINIPLYKTPLGWGLTSDENEAIAYFKLLVTTEELAYYQLLQDGINSTRGDAIEWKPIERTGDWCSMNIKVHLIRQKELKENGEVTLGNGKLTLHAHGLVQAMVSLSSAYRIHISQDPASKFPGFESADWVLMDFSSEKDSFRQNVLELGHLRVDKEKLRSDPLEIILQESLEPTETILAVAFDGQDFKVIGEVEETKGVYVIRINEIPDPFNHLTNRNELVANPFNELDLQHNSLYDRWKIAFFRGKKEGSATFWSCCNHA